MMDSRIDCTPFPRALGVRSRERGL